MKVQSRKHTTVFGAILCVSALFFAPVSAISAETPEQIFSTAIRALSSGDYTAAEKGFLRILQISPRHIGALGNLGVVYSRTQQTDKAIATYRKALTIQPDDPKLLLNLGLAFLKAESPADAVPVLQKAARLDPQNIQIRELLATAQLGAGQVNAAITAAENLRKQDPRNPALLYVLGVGYLKRNSREAARAAFDEFLSAAPPARAALVMCKAYYESGLLEEADAQCRKALQLEPALEGAEKELGKVLVSRRSPEAEKALKAALQRDPSDAEALYFLGGLLVQNNRTTQAIPYLERARDLNPGFWGNYFYLGRAKLQSSDAAGALPLLEKAADLNSAESAIWYQLGRAYTSAGKPDKAKYAMNRVRELKAQNLEGESRTK